MGACPLRVDVPDFAAVKDALAPPRIVVMQVAAFAHWLDCFSGDEAFAASQDPRVRVAAESFFPTGLTPLDDGPAPNRAEALFSGHVLSVSPLANPEDGGHFFHLRVRTYGGEYDVVADAALVAGAPVVGGVVQGAFWLSGRLAP